MRISFIVAKSENHVIGKNNQLPWHLKDDLQNFKKITMGHHILMGRKTFESIGKPLPGRLSLVVSTQSKPNTENVLWFNSIFRAIKHAERNGETESFIIGGEQIFRSALSLADRIYLTEVKGVVDGNVYFPSLSLKNWKKVSEQHFEKNAQNDYDFSIQILDRK
jgi:dihydrofolate reductase